MSVVALLSFLITFYCCVWGSSCVKMLERPYLEPSTMIFVSRVGSKYAIVMSCERTSLID